MSDPKTRIAELKRHYHDRLDEIRGILKTGPMNATEVAALMTWSTKHQQWEDFEPLQRWFATHEALSHLEHLVAQKEVSEDMRGGISYFQLTSRSFLEKTIKQLIRKAKA